MAELRELNWTPCSYIDCKARANVELWVKGRKQSAFCRAHGEEALQLYAAKRKP